MAKSRSSKLSEGARVRVNEGVAMPEFPTVDISGWTGAVVDSQGKGGDVKYIVEWDAPTLQRMPNDYRAHCDANGLFAGMACLTARDVAAADA